MPEIEFTIDPQTGKLELQVSGIVGPACEDVAKLAREFLGIPARDENTPEYTLRSRVRPQIQPKQRG